jgi:hypothetical protein
MSENTKEMSEYERKYLILLSQLEAIGFDLMAKARAEKDRYVIEKNNPPPTKKDESTTTT